MGYMDSCLAQFANTPEAAESSISALMPRPHEHAAEPPRPGPCSARARATDHGHGQHRVCVSFLGPTSQRSPEEASSSNICCLTVLVTRRPRSGVGRAVLPRGLWGRVLLLHHCSCGMPLFPSLPPSSHERLLPVCLCVSSPLCIRTPVILGRGSLPPQDLLLT